MSLGHAAKVAASEANFTSVFYIPHHDVVSSWKKRVVFNASAIFQGSSLKSFLFKGPDLLNDLIGILLRFRLRRVPISADIEKMFHQVRMMESDRPYVSFIWRLEQPDKYRMIVHVLGAVSSLTSCQFVLNHCPEENSSTYGDMFHLFRTCFYADDYLDSVDDEELAIQRCQRLSEMLLKGSFRLTFKQCFPWALRPPSSMTTNT